MALPLPFLNGKDSVMRLFIDGDQEVILNAKSWTAEADVTEVTDGVNGEDRDRLDSFINFWKFSAVCFMDKTGQIQKWLDYFANQDAQVPPLEVAAGIGFKIRDGSKRTYVAQEAVLGACSINNSDRKERVMVTINFRSRYFKEAPSI